MSWQRSFWFRVPFTKQFKRDKIGHGEKSINNAATLALHMYIVYIMICLDVQLDFVSAPKTIQTLANINYTQCT